MTVPTLWFRCFTFQSLDWVDVDFDPPSITCLCCGRKFQSLDWVYVDFDHTTKVPKIPPSQFQSLDWVDVDFDKYLAARGRTLEGVSIPRLG